MTRPIATMITSAVLAVATVGCGSASDPASGTDGFESAGAGLCTAATEAATDLAAARETFFDRVHQPLHQLADETAGRDRAVAARLLQAKQAVEAAFDTDTDTDSAATVSTLEDLVAATDEALRALDRSGLVCEAA